MFYVGSRDTFIDMQFADCRKTTHKIPISIGISSRFGIVFFKQLRKSDKMRSIKGTPSNTDQAIKARQRPASHLEKMDRLFHILFVMLLIGVILVNTSVQYKLTPAVLSYPCDLSAEDEAKCNAQGKFIDKIFIILSCSFEAEKINILC